MIGEYSTNPLAVSLFGAVMAFNTLLFIALHAYILRNLITPYLLGAAAAWLSVYAAFLLYMITPLFFIVPPQARDAAQQGR